MQMFLEMEKSFKHSVTIWALIAFGVVFKVFDVGQVPVLQIQIDHIFKRGGGFIMKDHCLIFQELENIQIYLKAIFQLWKII